MQKKRTPENFPKMKVRGGTRRHGKRKSGRKPDVDRLIAWTNSVQEMAVALIDFQTKVMTDFTKAISELTLKENQKI